MTCRLVAITFDANEPVRLSRFWAGLLGWSITDDFYGGVELTPVDDTGFRIRFMPTQNEKVGQNQMHFDLTSTSLEDQQRTVRKALELGAQNLDIGQGSDAPHVVLADLEGNEFCVIEPGNQFLADCGLIGAVACEGSKDVGYFWSEVLGWPLVWDQNEETAIRSPIGGPKITWSGPPLTPKAGKYRLHFDIAPDAESHQFIEVERLISMGASRIDIGQGDVSWVVMVDPDGHEFCVEKRLAATNSSE
jgi:hypothetical protein